MVYCIAICINKPLSCCQGIFSCLELILILKTGAAILLSAIIMYLTAPKATSEEGSALSRS
jgi:hypothetical protein